MHVDHQAADPQLVEQFRRALDHCRSLFRDAARQCIAAHAQGLRRDPAAFAERLEELERGLVVKIFVEIAQSDRQWTESEIVLAQELIEHCWDKRLDRQRLRAALPELVDQASTLSWRSLVRPFLEFPVLRERVGELLTVVVRLANLTAKIDGRISPDETARLRRIQAELEQQLVPIPLAPESDERIVPSREQDGQRLGSSSVAAAARRSAAQAPPSSREEQLAAALRELHGLIGLESIKRDVQELVNFLKVQEQRARLGLPRTQISLHTAFRGNPGTGKTTVARLLGRLLGGLGILARGHLVETDRSGLVAKYAGQTGPKTHQKIDEALDGVLFVDEAYSLVSDQGDDAYGAEALQALLKRMEDDRQRLVVVLAGYPEPLEQLLESNPGLASRFSRRLDFPDYSAAELGRIFHAMCQTNHYVLPSATRLKLLLGFQHLLDHRGESFGNGRLARNVFETSIRRLANRIADTVPLTAELLTTLEPPDILLPDVADEAYRRRDEADLRLSTLCPGCGQSCRCLPPMLGQAVKCRHCEHTFTFDWGELPPDDSPGRRPRT